MQNRLSSKNVNTFWQVIVTAIQHSRHMIPRGSEKEKKKGKGGERKERKEEKEEKKEEGKKKKAGK